MRLLLRSEHFARLALAVIGEDVLHGHHGGKLAVRAGQRHALALVQAARDVVGRRKGDGSAPRQPVRQAHLWHALLVVRLRDESLERAERADLQHFQIGVVALLQPDRSQRAGLARQFRGLFRGGQQVHKRAAMWC